MTKTRGVYKPSYRDKDGNKKYSNIWWICYAANGEMSHESSKSTRKSDAIELLEQRKAEIRFGKLPQLKKHKKLTFKQFSIEYLKFMENQKSYKGKEYIVKRLVGKLGNIALQDFTIKLTEQFRNQREHEGLKQASVNQEVRILKHMFSVAYDWDYIGEQTIKQIKKVKQFPEDKGRVRFLSKDDEYPRLIKACENTFLKPIVMVALNTGLRKMEILNLTWDRIDLNAGFIFLEKTKNNESAQVPINETVRNILINIPRRLDIRHVFFNSHTEKPLNEYDIQYHFTSAVKRAKIKDFTFHDLRHTFGSYLAMAGVTLPALQKLLRHKDITMTMRYIHLMPSYTTEAIKKLDAIFKPTIKKLKSVV